jgi:uridine kinase
MTTSAMLSTDRSARIQSLAMAISAVQREHPVRVAIDGVDGSGKTTLADELAISMNGSGREIIRASVDGFHNPREVRHARGPDSPEGYFHDSFDYTALKQSLLEPLGPAGNGVYRTAHFDYRANRPLEAAIQFADQNGVLLFDGVFLHRKELYDAWDLTIWVEAPFEVTIERAVARDSKSGGADPAAVRSKYAQRYVPGQRLYLEECHPEKKADIVFDNTDFEFPKIAHRGANRQCRCCCEAPQF